MPLFVTQRNDPVARVKKSVPELYWTLNLSDDPALFITNLFDPRRDLLRIGDGSREHEQCGRARGQDNALFPHRSALRIGDVVHLVKYDHTVAARASIQLVSIDLGRSDDHVRVSLDLSITSQEPHGKFRAKDLLKLGVFRVRKRLERRCVHNVVAAPERVSHALNCDVGLTRTSRSDNERVNSGSQVRDCLALKVVDDEGALLGDSDPFEESLPRFVYRL